MKSQFLFCLFFLWQFSVFCQITITGKVTDKNNTPLLGASVYINNSTIGTTTDDEGMFIIDVKEGVYTLVISFVGFETIQYQLNTYNYKKTTFKLLASGIQLDEVVIANKNNYSKERRAFFLRRFRTHFLGKGYLSDDCVILNKDVISFDYNKKTLVLEAYAAKPIEIKNKALGYTLFYDLVHFELTPTKVYYLGYSRFQELKGSKRRTKRWDKARKKAFLGSKTHFYQTLFRGDIQKEGYELNLYKRFRNPLRPSQKEIDDARAYLRLSGKTRINFKSFDRKVLVSKLDTVKDILTRSRLKEFKDTLVKKAVTRSDFLKVANNNLYFDYDNILEVNYMNEKEESGYRLGAVKLPYQKTKILLLKKPARLFKEGTLEEPFSVFYDGYFGFEKVAYQLPLDYVYK